MLSRFVVVTLLATAAIIPLIDSRLPLGSDSVQHTLRVVELDWHLRNGVFFPRVAADLGRGFGYPLFNFYAPALYYFAEAFHLLRLDFVPALLAVVGLSVYLAALGAFKLAEDYISEVGGYVAAAGYVFAPIFFYKTLAQSAFAEVLAMAILPWLLWSVGRLIDRPLGRWWMLTAGLYALLLLSHNIAAMIGTAVVGIFLLFFICGRFSSGVLPSRPARSVSRPEGAPTAALPGVSVPMRGRFAEQSVVFPSRPEGAPTGVTKGVSNYHLPLTTALTVGLLLSAFFWLPALLELRFVQIAGATRPDFADFHRNFIPLAEIFSLPVRWDPKLVWFLVPQSLSLPVALLAFLGAIAGFRQTDRRLRTLTGFCLTVTLIAVFLAWPQSVKVWEALPLLQFLQSPDRLFGPASLCLALLAGGATRWLSGLSRLPARFASTTSAGEFHSPALVAERRAGRWKLPAENIKARSSGLLAAAVSLVVGVYSLTWSFGPKHDLIIQPTILDVREYERESGHIGTTTAGEFLPIWVEELPPFETLDSEFAGGPRVIERLDRSQLPSGVTIVSSASGLLFAIVAYDSPQPFTARFNWFYFPGWQAALDGAPITILPSQPNGLITVYAPAGQHTLRVEFAGSVAQWAGAAISALAVIGLIGGYVVSASRKRIVVATLRSAPVGSVASWPGRLKSSLRTRDPSPFVPLRVPAWIAVAGLALITVRLITGYWNGAPFVNHRFDGRNLAGVDQTLSVNFGGAMELLGADLPPETSRADRPLRFTLYWRVLQPTEVEYSVSTRLVTPDGRIYGQDDSQHPNDRPTTYWQTDQYARDEHALLPLAGTPPGEYRIVVGVYRQDTGEALPVLGSDGNPLGPEHDVARIVIAPPTRPPSDDELAPQVRLNAGIGPLTLVGFDLPVTAVSSGDELPMTLFWRAGGERSPDLTARLYLVGSDGSRIVLGEFPPVRADYPTSRWPPAAALRAPHSFLIPPDVPGGQAILYLGLRDASGAIAGADVRLAEINVAVPQRMFALPDQSLNPTGALRSLQSLNLHFGPSIKMVGYALDMTNVFPGDRLPLAIYWQSTGLVTSRYKVFVHLLDAEGRIVAQRDSVPASGARPTTGWLPEEIIADEHQIVLPPDARPGLYRLAVGLYDATTGERVTIADETGQVIGDRVILGEVVLQSR